MRAFVTGLDGFVGQWLARELLASGDEVAGGSRNANPSYSILSAEEGARIQWFPFELQSGRQIAEALRAWQPDAIYHLAAQASVKAGFEDPVGTIEANVMGTVRLMEACVKATPNAAVLYAGSADAYGDVTPGELPLKESSPLRPGNPYAASKAAGEVVALQYAHTAPMRVVATRSFNHTGPGQRTAFAVPAFAAQIASIARKRQPTVLRVGNLAPKRDFSDVRDVVRAYRLLIERGHAGGAYNVCSSTSVSMRAILDQLVALAGIKVSIDVDPTRLRPTDSPDVVGDNQKLHSHTGWRPARPLTQTLRDVLEWEMQA